MSEWTKEHPTRAGWYVLSLPNGFKQPVLVRHYRGNEKLSVWPFAENAGLTVDDRTFEGAEWFLINEAEMPKHWNKGRAE